MVAVIGRDAPALVGEQLSLGPHQVRIVRELLEEDVDRYLDAGSLA
jgi:hypothetical protein